MNAAPGQLGGTEAHTVVARIGGHEPRRLAEAVDAWLADLAARGRRPATVNAYRRTVAAWSAASGCGWAHDLSYANAAAWMASKRAAGDWSGKSYNHALAALRSLSAFAARAGWVARDEFAFAGRSAVDDAPGSRAATTDEARAIVAQAVMRSGDGRARGDRALWWLAMFTAGARFSEPGKWRWSDLLLDEIPPRILWRPEAQKVARRVELVLAPELAAKLIDRRPAGGGGASPVFPVRATRPAFEDDRTRAGIAKVDARGRSISPHSARKWFSTALTEAGVPDRLVDRMMRHAGGVPQKYYDPPVEAQVAALAGLPYVWPTAGEFSFRRPVDTAEGIGVNGEATPMQNHHRQPDDPRPAGSIGVATSRPSWAGLHGLSQDGGPAGAGPELDPVIGVSAPVNAASSSDAAAALLEAQAHQLLAAARLLRGR